MFLAEIYTRLKIIYDLQNVNERNEMMRFNCHFGHKNETKLGLSGGRWC